MTSINTIKNSHDQQNISSSSYKIRSTNTFNKITSINIRLLMRNEVNNWQEVSFLILPYKTTQNMLTSSHQFTKQNIIQISHSFCEIAKKSA